MYTHDFSKDQDLPPIDDSLPNTTVMVIDATLGETITPEIYAKCVERSKSLGRPLYDEDVIEIIGESKSQFDDPS